MGKQRLVIACASDTTEELDRLANKKGITKIEVVRRALALYFLLDSEIDGDKGKKLAVIKNDELLSKLLYY